MIITYNIMRNNEKSNFFDKKYKNITINYNKLQIYYNGPSKGKELQ